MTTVVPSRASCVRALSSFTEAFLSSQLQRWLECLISEWGPKGSLQVSLPQALPTTQPRTNWWKQEGPDLWVWVTVWKEHKWLYIGVKSEKEIYCVQATCHQYGREGKVWCLVSEHLDISRHSSAIYHVIETPLREVSEFLLPTDNMHVMIIPGTILHKIFIRHCQCMWSMILEAKNIEIKDMWHMPSRLGRDCPVKTLNLMRKVGIFCFSPS